MHEREWSRAAAWVLALLPLCACGSGPVHGRESADAFEDRLAPAFRTVELAVAEGVVPGAVLLVGQGDDRRSIQATGALALVPQRRPLEADSLFDLASLTKPVATATAVMILVERGLVELEAPVARYLPGFAAEGKGNITVEHLLRHWGGLIPDNSLDDYGDGYGPAMERIFALEPLAPPGTTFRYTDVGFILLGHLVQAVDGRALDRFCQEEIFEPLGMVDTQFNPDPARRARCATTAKEDGVWLQGVVHDPRARALGGVAGHAGLFSTAGDLGRWCRMLLGGGALDGRRILKPETVQLMLTPRWLPDGSGGRALGVDVDSPYSSPRGELFPRGTSFGHSGFTGTSLWFDPTSGVHVVLLTSRLHPQAGGDVIGLRRRLGTAVARALLPGLSPPEPPVLTGADRLAAEACARLKGMRVGLLTNPVGRTITGLRTLDLLARAPGVELVRVFTPEHGLRAALEGAVPDGTDPLSSVDLRSLYGDRRRPEPADLEGLDAVLVDLQDVGVRYYTYATTTAYLMEACATAGVKVIVLDRPNPIGFLGPRGPLADEDRLGFISHQPTPVAHGLTLGELTLYFRAKMALDLELEVVTCLGWNRSMAWEATGLTWINPSPNLRSPTQSLLYPMTGLLEACNLSVGRGTDQPFERVGAPWIQGPPLARALNAMELPGLTFTPIEFTPRSSRFEGELCQGVLVGVSDRTRVEPVVAGLAMAWQLNRLHSPDFQVARANDRMLNLAAWESLMTCEDPLDLASLWREDLAGFWEQTAPFRLYGEHADLQSGGR